MCWGAKGEPDQRLSKWLTTIRLYDHFKINKPLGVFLLNIRPKPMALHLAMHYKRRKGNLQYQTIAESPILRIYARDDSKFQNDIWIIFCSYHTHIWLESRNHATFWNSPDLFAHPRYIPLPRTLFSSIFHWTNRMYVRLQNKFRSNYCRTKGVQLCRQQRTNSILML